MAITVSTNQIYFDSVCYLCFQLFRRVLNFKRFCVIFLSRLHYEVIARSSQEKRFAKKIFNFEFENGIFVLLSQNETG